MLTAEGSGTIGAMRSRLEDLIDEQRVALHDSLDGLSEEEARRRLVPSRTTLLGLLTHVTWVEGVWYGEAITGKPQRGTPDSSFRLRKSDTVDSVRARHREACAASRKAVAALELDAVVTGRGERRLWEIHVHMLRELARHAGHADILREQVLAAR
ncbi:DinB family protein [Pseudonocardia oroxyli]|uniref:DinB superfamily protein n=1 Tax=Pseudonocardia oroxyli TaxID=366584 RepID=A0A1G8E1B3_PSEOR|nr:DinB family protein [Pseudonocardia oroxyli]SDH63736.1 Protein of unknown function [Pseudonocardia oroxyli]